jgi:hypothetical protein
MSMGNAVEPESPQTYDVSTPTAIANLFNRYFMTVRPPTNNRRSRKNTLSARHHQGYWTWRNSISTSKRNSVAHCTFPHPNFQQLVKPWRNTKLANIVPIHKKGEKSQVEKHRPISLLNIISKVLERCVLRNIRDHLLKLINDSQHGFIPGKSCTTQLLEVLDYIGSLLDGGKQTDVVYMDMSKAFDKVHHKYLISKLRNVYTYGISGKLLRWFESYLLNRKLYPPRDLSCQEFHRVQY